MYGLHRAHQILVSQVINRELEDSADVAAPVKLLYRRRLDQILRLIIISNNSEDLYSCNKSPPPTSTSLRLKTRLSHSVTDQAAPIAESQILPRDGRRFRDLGGTLERTRASPQPNRISLANISSDAHSTSSLYSRPPHTLDRRRNRLRYQCGFRRPTTPTARSTY